MSALGLISLVDEAIDAVRLLWLMTGWLLKHTFIFCEGSGNFFWEFIKHPKLILSQAFEDVYE